MLRRSSPSPSTGANSSRQAKVLLSSGSQTSDCDEYDDGRANHVSRVYVRLVKPKHPSDVVPGVVFQQLAVRQPLKSEERGVQNRWIDWSRGEAVDDSCCGYVDGHRGANTDIREAQCWVKRDNR